MLLFVFFFNLVLHKYGTTIVANLDLNIGLDKGKGKCWFFFFFFYCIWMIVTFSSLFFLFPFSFRIRSLTMNYRPLVYSIFMCNNSRFPCHFLSCFSPCPFWSSLDYKIWKEKFVAVCYFITGPLCFVTELRFDPVLIPIMYPYIYVINYVMIEM